MEIKKSKNGIGHFAIGFFRYSDVSLYIVHIIKPIGGDGTWS